MRIKTPGVYVEETSVLPASVAEVATAIPAFVGYVERGTAAARITSLVEYRTLFGAAPPSRFTAHVTANGTIAVARIAEPATETLFYHLDHYFANGGGACWIVPVGGGADATADFVAGLARVEQQDEPTLILLPQAPGLLDLAGYGTLAQGAMAQCARLRDRFVILDVPGGDVAGFRGAIGSDNLSRAAAYHPYLATTITWLVDDTAVTVSRPAGDGTADASLADLRTTDAALCDRIGQAIAGIRVILPPSSAVAGAYARTDHDRGVWKAPANVAIRATTGPVTRITDADMEGLTIDGLAGKSINPIRAFPQKGTLIWGARTLAGNDDTWRYVSVRRLCLMIEESIRKGTAFAVFEPNDARTWARVGSMIDGYLNGLWRRGGLVGATSKQAYFVKVGLGQTMVARDLIDGLLIVEIGIAPVRPFEFIILRVTHRLQSG